MRDRNVQYPNRFHVRPVAGTDDIFEIIPAPGTVYEEGTFFNKANMLKDTTAELYEFPPEDMGNVVPDDVLAKIHSMVKKAQETADISTKIAEGSYIGTGNYGLDVWITLSFPFIPKLVFVSPIEKIKKPGSSMPSGSGPLVLVNGSYFAFVTTSVNGASNLEIDVQWNENTVKYQIRTLYTRLNENEWKYKYIAIG